MKKFVELEGYIIAVDAIAMVNPSKDGTGKVLVLLKDGTGHMFAEESVAKLRAFLGLDCMRL